MTVIAHIQTATVIQPTETASTFQRWRRSKAGLVGLMSRNTLQLTPDVAAEFYRLLKALVKEYAEAAPTGQQTNSLMGCWSRFIPQRATLHQKTTLRPDIHPS